MTEDHESGDCCPISDDQSDVESKALSFGPRRVRPDEFDAFVDKESARARARQLGCIGIRQYDSTTGGVVWLPCSNESDYRRVTGNSPLGRRQRRRALQNEVREILKGKALGPTIGDMGRDMNPFTAIDADGDMIVLEGVPTVNMGRGVPDPTPGATGELEAPKLPRATKPEPIEQAERVAERRPKKRVRAEKPERIDLPEIDIPPLSEAVKPRRKPAPSAPEKPAVKYREVSSQISDLSRTFADQDADLFSVPQRQITQEASRRLAAMASGYSPSSRVSTGSAFLRAGDDPAVANAVAFSREIGSQKANRAASELTERIASEKTRLNPSARNVAGGSATLLSRLLSSDDDSEMLKSNYSLGTSDLFSDRYVSSLENELSSGRLPKLASYISDSFGQTQNGNRRLSYMLGMSDSSLTRLRRAALSGLAKQKPTNSPNGIFGLDSDPFELSAAALLARRYLLNHSENFGPSQPLWSAVDEMTGSNQRQTESMFSNMLGKNSDLLKRMYDTSQFVSSYGNNLLRLSRSVLSDMVDTDWDDIKAIERAKDLSGDEAVGSMASYYPMERRQPGKWSPIVSHIQDQVSQNDYMAAVGRGLTDEAISKPNFFDASFGDLINEAATLLSIMRDRAEWGLLPWREYASGWLDENRRVLDLDEFDPADMRSLFDSKGKKLPVSLFKSIGLLSWAASSMVGDEYTMPNGRKTTLEERESVLESIQAIAEAWGNTLLPEYSRLSVARGPKRKMFSTADTDDAKLAQERDEAVAQASQELVSQLKAATSQKLISGASDGPSTFATDFIDSFAEAVERLSLDKYATDEVFSNVSAAMTELAESAKDKYARKRMRNLFPSILDSIRDAMSTDDDSLAEVVGRTLNSSAPRIARRRTQRRIEVGPEGDGATGLMGSRPQPKRGAKEGAIGIQKLPINWVRNGGVEDKFDPIDQASRNFWDAFQVAHRDIVNKLNSDSSVSQGDLIKAINDLIEDSFSDLGAQSITFDWQRDWTRKAMVRALTAPSAMRNSIKTQLFGTIDPTFSPTRSSFPYFYNNAVKRALKPFTLATRSTSWGMQVLDRMTGRTIAGLHMTPRDDATTNAANALGNVMWAFLEGPQSQSRYTGMPGDEISEGSPIGNEYEYSYNSWLRNPFQVSQLSDGRIVGVRLAKKNNQTALRNTFRQLVHDLWDAAESVTGGKVQGRPGPVYQESAVSVMSDAINEVEDILKSYSVQSQTIDELAEKVSVVMRHRHGRVPDEVGELWQSIGEFSSLMLTDEPTRMDSATAETVGLAAKAGISLVLGVDENAVDAMSPQEIGASVGRKMSLPELYNEIRDIFSPNSVMSLRNYREDASHSTRNFVDVQTNNFVTSDQIKDAIESVYPGFHDGYLAGISTEFGAAGEMAREVSESEEIAESVNFREQKEALERRKYVKAVYDLESVDDFGESAFKLTEWKRSQLSDLAESSDWLTYAAIGGVDPVLQFVVSDPVLGTTFDSAKTKLKSFVGSTSGKNIDSIFDSVLRNLGILPEGSSSVPQRTAGEEFNIPNVLAMENSVSATLEMVAALRSGILQTVPSEQLPPQISKETIIEAVGLPEYWPVPLVAEELDLIPSPREISKLAKDMVALDRRQMLEFLGAPETTMEVAEGIDKVATGASAANVRRTAQFIPTDPQRTQNELLDAVRGSDDETIDPFVESLSLPQLDLIADMPRSEEMKNRLRELTDDEQIKNLVVSSALKAGRLNLTEEGRNSVNEKLSSFDPQLKDDGQKAALLEVLRGIASGDHIKALDAYARVTKSDTTDNELVMATAERAFSDQMLNELMRFTYESFARTSAENGLEVSAESDQLAKMRQLRAVAKAMISGEDYASVKEQFAKVLIKQPVDGVGQRMVVVADPSEMDNELLKRNSELSSKLAKFDGSLDQAREIVALMTDAEVSSLVARRIVPLMIQKQMHDAWNERVLAKANSQLDMRLRQIGRRMRKVKSQDGMPVGDLMGLIDEAIDQAFGGRTRDMLSPEELVQFGDAVAYFVAGGREIMPADQYKGALRAMRKEASDRVEGLIRRWREEEDEENRMWEKMIDPPIEDSFLELLRATSTPKTREEIIEDMERNREERYGRRPDVNQRKFEGEDPGLVDDSFWQMFEPKPTIRGDDYGDVDITGFMAGNMGVPPSPDGSGRNQRRRGILFTGERDRRGRPKDPKEAELYDEMMSRFADAIEAENLDADMSDLYNARRNTDGSFSFEDGEDILGRIEGIAAGDTEEEILDRTEPRDEGDFGATGEMAEQLNDQDIEPIGRSLMKQDQSERMFGQWTYQFARTFFSQNVGERNIMLIPMTADPVMYARSQKAIDAMWRVKNGNIPAIVAERLYEQEDGDRGKEWFDDLVYSTGWYMRNAGMDVPEGYDPALPENATSPIQRQFLDAMAELAALALHFDYAVRIPRRSSGGQAWDWQAEPRDRPVLLAGDYHSINAGDFVVSEGTDASGRRISRWIWDPKTEPEQVTTTTTPLPTTGTTVTEQEPQPEVDVVDDATPFLEDAYVEGVTSLANGMIEAMYGSKYSFNDWLDQGNRYSRILGGDHYEKSGFGPSVLERIQKNPSALDMGRVLQELADLDVGIESGLRSWIGDIPSGPEVPDPDFGPPLPNLRAARVATDSFSDISDAEMTRQKKIGVTSDSKASKDARSKWWSLLTTGEKKSIYEIASTEKTSDGVNWHPDIIESGIRKYGRQNNIATSVVDASLAAANKAGSERGNSVARTQALAVIAEIANEERSIYGALSRLDEELKHREKFRKETAQQYQDLIRRPLQASARALNTLVEMTNIKVKELDDAVTAGRKTKAEALSDLERFFGVIYPQFVSMQNNVSRYTKMADASRNAISAIDAEMDEIRKYVKQLASTIGVSVRYVDERMRQLRATKQGLATLGDQDSGGAGFMAIGGSPVPVVGVRTSKNPSRRRLMSSTEKSFVEAAKNLARKRTDVAIPSSAYDVIPSLEAMRSRIMPEPRALPDTNSMSSIGMAVRSALNDFAASKTAEDILREKLGDRFLTFETIGLRSLPGKTRRVAEDAMTEGIAAAMDANSVTEADVMAAVRFHAEAAERARTTILSNSRTDAARILNISSDQVDDAIATEEMQKNLSTAISSANAMARRLAKSHSRNYVTRVIGNKFASMVRDGVPIERLISPSDFARSQAVESARNAVFMSRRSGVTGRFLSALTGVNSNLSRLIGMITKPRRPRAEQRTLPSNWPTMSFTQRQDWLRSSEAIRSLGRFGAMEQMRAVQEEIEQFGISDGPLMAFAGKLFRDSMVPGLSPSAMINSDGRSPIFSAEPMSQGDFVRTGTNGYSTLVRRLPSLSEISDEGLARFLNARESSIRSFKNGQTFLTNDAADMVAEAFGLPAAELWGARGERPDDMQGHFYWLASTWADSGDAIALLDDGMPVAQVAQRIDGGEQMVRRISSLMRSGIVNAFFDELQLQSISVEDADNYVDSLGLRKRRDAIMMLASAGYTEPEIVSATNFNANTVRNVLREARSSGKAPAAVGSRAWINANMSAVRADARSGMSKREMMRKYGIGSRTLNAMLEYGGDVTYRSAYDLDAVGDMASRRLGDDGKNPEIVQKQKAKGSSAPSEQDAKIIKSRMGIERSEQGKDIDSFDALPAVVANPFSNDVPQASLGADGRPKGFASPDVEKMWGNAISDFVRYSFSGGRIKKLRRKDWISDVESSLDSLGEAMFDGVNRMMLEQDSDEIASLLEDAFSVVDTGEDTNIPETKLGRVTTYLSMLGTLTEEQALRLVDDFAGIDDELESDETTEEILNRVKQNFGSWADGMRSTVAKMQERYGVNPDVIAGWGSRIFLDGMDLFNPNEQRGMEQDSRIPEMMFDNSTLMLSLSSMESLVKPQYERFYFVPDQEAESAASPMVSRDSGIAFVAPPATDLLGVEVDTPEPPREVMMRFGGTHSQRVLDSMAQRAVPSEYLDSYKGTGYFAGLEGILQFMAKTGFAGLILNRMGIDGDSLPDDFGSFEMVGPNPNELPTPLRNLAKLIGAPESSTGVPTFNQDDVSVMRRVIPYMKAADAELTRLSGRTSSVTSLASAMLPEERPDAENVDIIASDRAMAPESFVLGMYVPRERRFSQVLTSIANAGNTEVAQILEEMTPRQLALTDWVYGMRSAMQAPLSLFRYMTQSDSPLRRRDPSGRVGYPLASESYDQLITGNRNVDVADAPRGVAAATQNRAFYGASLTSVQPSDVEPFGSEMAETAGGVNISPEQNTTFDAVDDQVYSYAMDQIFKKLARYNSSAADNYVDSVLADDEPIQRAMSMGVSNDEIVAALEETKNSMRAMSRIMSDLLADAIVYDATMAESGMDAQRAPFDATRTVTGRWLDSARPRRDRLGYWSMYGPDVLYSLPGQGDSYIPKWGNFVEDEDRIAAQRLSSTYDNMFGLSTMSDQIEEEIAEALDRTPTRYWWDSRPGLVSELPDGQGRTLLGRSDYLPTGGEETDTTTRDIQFESPLSLAKYVNPNEAILNMSPDEFQNYVWSLSETLSGRRSEESGRRVTTEIPEVIKAAFGDLRELGYENIPYDKLDEWAGTVVAELNPKDVTPDRVVAELTNIFPYLNPDNPDDSYPVSGFTFDEAMATLHDAVTSTMEGALSDERAVRPLRGEGYATIFSGPDTPANRRLRASAIMSSAKVALDDLRSKIETNTRALFAVREAVKNLTAPSQRFVDSVNAIRQLHEHATKLAEEGEINQPTLFRINNELQEQLLQQLFGDPRIGELIRENYTYSIPDVPATEDESLSGYATIWDRLVVQGRNAFSGDQSVIFPNVGQLEEMMASYEDETGMPYNFLPRQVYEIMQRMGASNDLPQVFAEDMNLLEVLSELSDAQRKVYSELRLAQKALANVGTFGSSVTLGEIARKIDNMSLRNKAVSERYKLIGRYKNEVIDPVLAGIDTPFERMQNMKTFKQWLADSGYSSLLDVSDPDDFGAAGNMALTAIVASRFTDDARNGVLNAADEVRNDESKFMTTGHLLLGAWRQLEAPDVVPGLKSLLGVADVATVRSAIADAIKTAGKTRDVGTSPKGFSRHASKALQNAIVAASERSSDIIELQDLISALLNPLYTKGDDDGLGDALSAAGISVADILVVSQAATSGFGTEFGAAGNMSIARAEQNRKNAVKERTRARLAYDSAWFNRGGRSTAIDDKSLVDEVERLSDLYVEGLADNTLSEYDFMGGESPLDTVAPRPYNSVMTYGELGQRPTDLVGAIRDAMIRADALVVSDSQRSRLNSVSSKLRLLFDNYMHVEAKDDGATGRMADMERTLADMMEPIEDMFAKSEKRDQKNYYSHVYGPVENVQEELEKSARIESFRSPFSVRNNLSYDPDDISWSTNDWVYRRDSSFIEGADAVIMRMRDGDINTAEVAMISRKSGPFRGALSTVGGLRDGDEDLMRTASREASEEVGLPEEQILEAVPLGVIESPDWDPRFVNGVRVGGGLFMVPWGTELSAASDATAAQWIPLKDIASGRYGIGFGHAEWLRRAVASMNVNPATDPFSEIRLSIAKRLSILAKVARLRNQRMISAINDVRRATGRPLFMESERMPHPMMPWGNRVARSVWEFGEGASGEMSGDRPKADTSLAERLQLMDVVSDMDNVGFSVTDGEALVSTTINHYGAPNLIGGNIIESARKDFLNPDKWKMPKRASQLWIPYVDRSIALASASTSPKQAVPRMWVLGGPSGSGKTTIRNNGLFGVPNYEDAVVVDPDDAKIVTPEFRNWVERGITNAAAVLHEESRSAAFALYGSAMELGMDIVYDSSGQFRDGNSLQMARDKGYKIMGYYAFAPIDALMTNVEERARRTGRSVDEGTVKSIAANLASVIPEILHYFDELYILDTERGVEKPLVVGKYTRDPGWNPQTAMPNQQIGVLEVVRPTMFRYVYKDMKNRAREIGSIPITWRGNR